MRILALLLLAVVCAGGWYWWQLQHWSPDEAVYPDQGVEVAARDGRVNFRTVRALGGRFAYLDASYGAKGSDAAFSRNLTAAREAGLQVGAVHRFDPCVMADGQSANFVTVVPRGADMLPPAIELAATADDCAERVTEAAVESELMTLINQIEGHAGKPVILKIMPGFETRYGLSARIERNLWLSRTRLLPDYAGRPWLLWTANEALRSEAAEQPLRWVVVQP
ncbi:MAG: glycoside hydrolase family 25 protein [Sphingomonadaceae bacterium]|nr:glycoside hydrolase family 25 protein [Sphingomonadaceae bacterium]